jgi:hypothetical protein
MKRIYIVLAFITAIVLTNCGDKELPYDLDGVVHGALIDVSKVTGSPQYVDYYDPTAVLEIHMQMPEKGKGNFDYVQLLFVYNRGQVTQETHIIEDNIKTLPQTFNVDFADILALLEKTDVVAGETYDFTANVVLKDGTTIYGWTPVTGFNNSAFAGWVVDGRPYSSAARYNVQASFQYDQWDSGVNNFQYTEIVDGVAYGPYATTVTQITEMPDPMPSGVSEEDLRGVSVTDLWVAGSTTKIWVNINNFSLIIPNQMIWDGDFSGYGTVWFEDCLPTAAINTLDNIMEFNVTPTLPDAGLWWGVTATYVIEISDKKEIVSVRASTTNSFPIISK